MKTVLARQSDLLSGIAKLLQSKPNVMEARKEKTRGSRLDPGFLDVCFDMVAFVYSHDLEIIEPYKKTLCTFVCQIHHFVVVEPRFKEYLRKTPRFGADLFCEHVFDRSQGGLMTWTSLPELCYGCGTQLKAAGFDDL